VADSWKDSGFVKEVAGDFEEERDPPHIIAAAAGKTPVAYYIPENGDRERLDGTYDVENGVMVVRTTHCSIYAVIDEEPAVEPIDDDGQSGDDNTMLYIGAAAVAVVLIAIAAVLISRRS